MATAYHTEAHERRYQNRTILIENTTLFIVGKNERPSKKPLKNGFMIFSVNMRQVKA